MYNQIVNPETGRLVNVNGKIGRRVLNNYVNQLGGAIRAGSRIPSGQYLQAGGHNGPCGVNASTGRCKKMTSWDRENCALKNGRCVKNKSPKEAAKKAVKKMVKKGKTVHPKKLKEVGARVPKKTIRAPKKTIRAPKKATRAPKKVMRKSPAKKAVRKVSVKKPRKAMRSSKKVKSHGKTVKTVTTKAHGTTQRLSAGEYYRNHGMDRTIGDRCDIRQNGEYKCLLTTKSGVARWAKKSKSGAGQEACEDWSSRCQEPDFA